MSNNTSVLLVEMRGVTKKFPGVIALNNVDFELKSGEVHMLLGENGAGKSTLIKVLSGAYIPNKADIFIDGEKIHSISPQTMLNKGLRFIYQEINLVQEIDIARNMFLGIEPLKMRALGIIDQKKLYIDARHYLEKFNIMLDPHHIVGKLSVTQQKMVEIARALITKAKVIVLDEPTDVLEDKSRHLLFDVIRNLKQNYNVGFIYISHRYAEVHELGDRVTILRDGKNIGTYNVNEITLDQVIEKMIGKKIGRTYPELGMYSSEESLKIENIKKDNIINDISLSVKKGEIVGITGLMGSGKTELARILSGADRKNSGKIFINGKEVKINTPIDAVRAGIGFLTEDRKSEGLVQNLSIRNNYAVPSLSRLTKYGFVRHKLIDKEISYYIEKLSIKVINIHHIANKLSGGNQQKAVIAKWLGARSKILLFDEPTRGIDINGRTAIYNIMSELAKSGVSILMFTSDYTEALEMSHRIIILHHGNICAEFERGKTTEEEILRYAIGVKRDR